MTYKNWQAIMTAFGYSDNLQTYDALRTVHAEHHRHYHTAEHISACLRHLETVRSHVDDWKSMALAFWFHDAIYKPLSSTNERDSADWSIEFLSANNAAPKDIHHIEDLIMATCHDAEGLSGDTQILVDIDLSILGTSPEIYDVYEDNIRKEYRWVPGFIYRKKRKEILQGFLDRSNIFGSDYFHEMSEKIARSNLSRAISKL